MIAGVEIKEWVIWQVWFVILRLGYDIVYLFTRFDNSSFSQSRDIIGGRQIFNSSRDLDHAPFKGDLSFICWDFI